MNKNSEYVWAFFFQVYLSSCLLNPSSSIQKTPVHTFLLPQPYTFSHKWKLSCEDVAYCAVTGGERGSEDYCPPPFPLLLTCHDAGRGSMVVVADAMFSYFKQEVRRQQLQGWALLS